MSQPIEFSPEALEAFKRQVQTVPGVQAVRLGVRGGACNGLQYVIEFDYELLPRNGDVILNPVGWDQILRSAPEGEKFNSVNFRVDKKSLLYLSGSKITWKKSLMKEGFEFENPNEISRCGCGYSFSIK